MLAHANAVYMVMHRESTRVYVGMTRQTVKERWRGHVSRALSSNEPRGHFIAAIRKFGPEAFDVYVLESGIPAEDLAARERHYVRVLKANERGRGFNSTAGGEANEAAAAARRGTTASAETRERLRQSHIGKRPSDETRARMSESQRRAQGTEVVRRAASARMLNKWADADFAQMVSERHRAAMAEKRAAGVFKAAASRRVLTDELRRKYAEAARRRWSKVKGN